MSSSLHYKRATTTVVTADTPSPESIVKTADVVRINNTEKLLLGDDALMHSSAAAAAAAAETAVS